MWTPPSARNFFAPAIATAIPNRSFLIFFRAEIDDSAMLQNLVFEQFEWADLSALPQYNFLRQTRNLSACSPRDNQFGLVGQASACGQPVADSDFLRMGTADRLKPVLRKAPSAIHHDHLPGDERRLCQKHDRVFDILRRRRCGRSGARRMKSSASSGASSGKEIVPGAMAFTVISGASARARQRVSMITPAFETQ